VPAEVDLNLLDAAAAVAQQALPCCEVFVDWKGQAPTHGIEEHIDAMKAYVDSAGGTPPQITSHPIGFGSGQWTCVIGEFEGGGRMVTVAKWVNGAIAEEYIWS
jgi:hypothetical protein